MKILVYSPAFYPSVGGLETVVAILAEEFVVAGHEVKVVSQTPTQSEQNFPFEVHRGLGPVEMLHLVNWCDLFFQANVSLRGLWPLLFVKRPLIISHHNWYERPDGRRGWQDRLKLFISRRVQGIAVSTAVNEHVGSSCIVIPNP